MKYKLVICVLQNISLMTCHGTKVSKDILEHCIEPEAIQKKEIFNAIEKMDEERFLEKSENKAMAE